LAFGVGAGLLGTTPPGLFFLGLSVLSGGFGIKLGVMGSDPADPNFKTIPQPTTPNFTPIAAGQGFSQSDVDTLNAVLTSEAKGMGLADVIATAINRTNTALAFGDLQSQAAQIQAANQYYSQLRTISGQLPAQLASAQTVLKNRGVNLQLASSDVSTFENNVLTNGLPPAFQQFLQNSGIDSSTVSDLTQLLTAQDPSKASGTLTDFMTDPTVTAALNSLSQQSTPITNASAPGSSTSTGSGSGSTTGTGSGSSAANAAFQQQVEINSLVIANLQAVFAQPIPAGSPIVEAFITSFADVNGDGFPDVTAVVYLRSGRSHLTRVDLVFDGLSTSAGLLSGPTFTTL
jgi:hypothetical protein